MQLRLCPLHESRRSTNCRTWPLGALGAIRGAVPASVRSARQPQARITVLTRGSRGTALHCSWAAGRSCFVRSTVYVGEHRASRPLGGVIEEAQRGKLADRRIEGAKIKLVISRLEAGPRYGSSVLHGFLPLRRPEQRRGDIPTMGNRAAVQSDPPS
jgi:hypothetical protein